MYVVEVPNVATLAGYKQRAHAEEGPRGSGSHVRVKRNGREWSPPACASAGMGRAAASVCAPAYGGGCMCRRISCMRHAVAGGSVGVAVFFFITTDVVAYESAVACRGGTGVPMGTSGP